MTAAGDEWGDRGAKWHCSGEAFGLSSNAKQHLSGGGERRGGEGDITLGRERLCVLYWLY